MQDPVNRWRRPRLTWSESQIDANELSARYIEKIEVRWARPIEVRCTDFDRRLVRSEFSVLVDVFGV